LFSSQSDFCIVVKEALGGGEEMPEARFPLCMDAIISYQRAISFISAL
jgi:hypothetical protein